MGAEDATADDDFEDADDDEDGMDDYETVGVPSAEQFTVYAADLNSCIIPMNTMELIRLLPSMQMASLLSIPHYRFEGSGVCGRFWLQNIHCQGKHEDKSQGSKMLQ